MKKKLKKYLNRLIEAFKPRKEHRFLQFLFTLTIVLKGIDGLFELIGGLFFVILKTPKLIDIISDILNYNIFHIPNDTIFDWVEKVSHALDTHVKVFIAILLIGNGVIKIALSINLLIRKLIVFPISIFFLILLLIYQTLQFIHTPSIYLFLFNLYDTIIIYVIWREYLYLKKQGDF